MGLFLVYYIYVYISMIYCKVKSILHVGLILGSLLVVAKQWGKIKNGDAPYYDTFGTKMALRLFLARHDGDHTPTLWRIWQAQRSPSEFLGFWAEIGTNCALWPRMSGLGGRGLQNSNIFLNNFLFTLHVGSSYRNFVQICCMNYRVNQFLLQRLITRVYI